MKKVLFSTTALVLSAGVAFAEAHTGVSISGYSGIWAADSGVSGEDIQIKNDIDITFSASGETDAGLGFGFDYTLTDSAGDGSSVDNWEVYISGSWGKLSVGDPDDALQSVAGLADIGFDGLGVDNRAEVARGYGRSSGVLYSNTFGAATVYLSMNKDTGVDDISAGVKFTTGAITVGLGYEDVSAYSAVDPADDLLDNTTMALDVSGSFGAVGFDVYYEDSDVTGGSYGTILSYDAGMATLNFGYADGDDDQLTVARDAAIGVGFSMDLGGGAELAGGVADDGTNTAWDLGIGMSF